jgi:signal transduction histidine kinase
VGIASRGRLRERLILVVTALAVFAATIAQLPAALGLSLHDPDASLVNGIVWTAIGGLWASLAWRGSATSERLWRLPSALFRGGLGGGALAVGGASLISLLDPGAGPGAPINALDDGLYELGVVALVSLAAFASTRSLVRPVLVGGRPPLGARDISLRARIMVATTGASFATAGILLNVLIDFGTTPPPKLAAYLVTAAGLLGASALIGWLVGEDTARGVETVTRRMRELARADGSARVEVPVVAADEVGDLTLAASELERRIRRDEATKAATTERERIARELHDGAAKSVSVLSLDIAALSARAPEDLRAPLRRIEHLAQVMAEELRAIVREFRARGETEPFDEALRRAVGPEGTATIELEGELQRVGTLARFEVTRVLEEAVRNARRHARARRVTARVRVDDGRLRVVVEDDGAGIRPFRWESLASDGHFGLLGMRERAQLLGGELLVARRQEGGTRVTLEVPLGGMSP